MEFTPLETLFPRMRVYEERPVTLPGTLRNSVWLTLIIEFVLLGLSVALPREFWQIRLWRGDFFFLVQPLVQPLVDLNNFLLSLGNVVMPHLMGLNLVGLLLALVSLTISFWRRQRMGRAIPLLVAVNLISSVISTISVVFMVTVLGVVFFISSFLWCISIAISVLIILVIFRLFFRR